MERLPVTSTAFKVFLRCQIVLEPLRSWSVKKHEWSKYLHVKNSPVVSWRNPKWKLLLRGLTKTSSFCYDCPSLGWWYICRLIEFPVNSRAWICACLCAWIKGKLRAVQKLISPSSSPPFVHNYKGNLWMVNIYTCPHNSTILRMKLTQENGLYTCFRLFLMLLSSTWNKRKKEKNQSPPCCWFPRIYWGKHHHAKIVQVYVSHKQCTYPLLCLAGKRINITYIQATLLWSFSSEVLCALSQE